VLLFPICFSLNMFGDTTQRGIPADVLESNAQQAVSARETGKAADLYDQAAQAHKKKGNLIKQADCLVESGKIRIDLQQYDEAYQRFLQASMVRNVTRLKTVSHLPNVK